MPGRDGFLKRDGEDFPFFHRLPGEKLRKESQTQIKFHHRQNLVGGSRLDIRLKEQPMLGKQLIVKKKGGGVPAQTDQRKLG